MTYPEALAWIASLEPRGWRLGLERMDRFVREAGLEGVLGPTPRYVHVAGTNGKGSVTAYTQSILVTAGLRTGGFFSPYVVDPRERVQLEGDLIDPELFAMLATRLRPVAERVGEVTEFEFKTALGLAAYLEHGCEWVALEVGLGGRFDATNVITPAVSVVVSISLDHTQILGDTEAAIAFEKAGIVKPGVPTVMGRLGPEAAAVVERVCAERGSELWRLNREITLSSGLDVGYPGGSVEGLSPYDLGPFSHENAALAVAALRAGGAPVSDHAIRDGLARTRLPGRAERRVWRGRPVFLDGAHNPASAYAVFNGLPAEGWEHPVLVTNMLAGHDADAFAGEMAKRFDRVITAPLAAPRALPAEETAARYRGFGCHATAAASLREALDEAAAEGPVVVTGSFYLVGEAIRLIDGA